MPVITVEGPPRSVEEKRKKHMGIQMILVTLL